jgi:transposase InsO family protein
MSEPRRQRTYDHRLRELVQRTGDLQFATGLGVPRSTAVGWLSSEPLDVVTLDVLDQSEVELQAEVLRLRGRILILANVIQLLLVLVRTFGLRFEWSRLPDGEARAAVLRAVQDAREVIPLPGVLRVLRLSPTRFHAWKRDAEACRPPGGAACPRRAPNRLTREDVATIKDMATSLEYRHVPTSRLAVLAQRLGRVVASASTWLSLIRERNWRRPRRRLHPEKPKIGLRTKAPNEAWHIDATVVRLLDGTKAYVHAVIDNFSRRILAFRVSDRLEVTSTVAVLEEAARRAGGADRGAKAPMLVVDGGVENFNGDVDAIVERGFLKRVLALADVHFSNSMIEAFWRGLKHQWLFNAQRPVMWTWMRLCGRGCVCPGLRLPRRKRLHITSSATEPFKPAHHVGSREGPFTELGEEGGCGKCLLLPAKSGSDVGVGRRELSVSEPGRDHGEVDANLEHVHRGRVPDDVWRNAPSVLESFEARLSSCAAKEVGHARARQSPAS